MFFAEKIFFIKAPEKDSVLQKTAEFLFTKSVLLPHPSAAALRSGSRSSSSNRKRAVADLWFTYYNPPDLLSIYRIDTEKKQQ
ncbi:MAG: hypothetical protein D3914_11020 [Candidatus Electrothrix sp. LOE2]|nr:hypothetical protein [Candidatus Electrothrix sp. LOE2]